MNNGKIIELLKALGFFLTCAGFMTFFMVYDNSKGLIYRMPEGWGIALLFIGFVISMLIDAFQRRSKQKKANQSPPQKKIDKFFFSLQKMGQKIVSLFCDLEIISSILVLPLVVIFYSIFHKDAVCKAIVVWVGILFCFRVIYIIDIIDLLRKKG